MNVTDSGCTLHANNNSHHRSSTVAQIFDSIYSSHPEKNPIKSHLLLMAGSVPGGRQRGAASCLPSPIPTTRGPAPTTPGVLSVRRRFQSPWSRRPRACELFTDAHLL